MRLHLAAFRSGRCKHSATYIERNWRVVTYLAEAWNRGEMPHRGGIGARRRIVERENRAVEASEAIVHDQDQIEVQRPGQVGVVLGPRNRHRDSASAFD